MDSELLNLDTFIQAIRSYPSWQVALELMLIGLVVFWVVRFLRGTRGARMLKGVAFVMISLYLMVRLVGAKFGLERIEFLYGKLLLFASFAVIVVFQPELRRALMRLGEAKLFRGFTTQMREDIDDLVESAIYLSRRKIGAVIAIEREVGLGGIAESGTRINADLSSALLNTIFWPNSPLHDLGVVVSQGKIAYAGVQFPLAEIGEVEERELGSRHRAAVGMSQETDAVVLVVSEETGDISIAERGQLIRKLSPDALRNLLTELLYGGAQAEMRKVGGLMSAPNPPRKSRPMDYWHDLQSSRRKWASEAFKRDQVLHTLRTLAWVAPLTVLIWFWAEREQFVTDNGVIFPVDVRTTEPGKRVVTLVNPSNRNVTVELSGTRSRLDIVRKRIEARTGPAEVQINIDPTLTPGLHEIKTADALSQLDIFRQSVITVRNCQPPTLQFEVDVMDERDVPVQAPAGLANLESATFVPPTIKLKGPRMLLDAQGRLAVTAEIAQSALGTSGERVLPAVSLIAPLHDDRVTMTPSTVQALLKIRQSDVQYAIASMPVYLECPAGLLDKYKVDYDPVLKNVTIYGSPEKIEQIKTGTLLPKPKAVLELSTEDAARTDRVFRKVQFDLPPGIRINDKEANREVVFMLTPRGAP